MATERVRTCRQSDATAEGLPPGAAVGGPAAFIPPHTRVGARRTPERPAVGRPTAAKAEAPPLSPPPSPKRRGRPAYDPTDRDRRIVTAMLRYHSTQAEIEAVLGITGKTLRKYFKTEIRIGFSLLLTAMWQSLADQGLGRPARRATATTPARAAVPPNVTATIAWLEFKAGAVRTERAALEDAQKAPLRVVVELVG